MGDVSPPTFVDKPEDGRALPLQRLIDLWLAIPRDQRRSVLRGLWRQEQKLTEISEDMRITGDPGKRRRRWAREQIEPTRTARWLLRGLSKALDPDYDKRDDGTPNGETIKIAIEDAPEAGSAPERP